MPINSLFPCFVEIGYQTKYSVHKHTIPTLGYASAGLGLGGSFITHDAGGIDAETMIEALINLIKVQVPPTTVYINYRIMTIGVVGDPPHPQFEKQISIAGTAVVDPLVFDRAVQATYTIRTSNFGLLKFVQLDHPSGNVFGNVYVLAPAEQAIVNALTAVSNGWAGRDNGQPTVFTNQSISLNKRLRRSYKMI